MFYYLLFKTVQILVVLLFLNVNFYGFPKVESVDVEVDPMLKLSNGCVECNLTLPTACNRYKEEIGEAEYRMALLKPAKYQQIVETPCRHRRSVNSARESNHPSRMHDNNNKIMRLNRIIDESRHRDNNLDEEESNPVPLKVKDLSRLSSLSRVSDRVAPPKTNKFKGQIEYKIKDIVSETLRPDINIDAIKEKRTNLKEDSIEPCISESEPIDTGDKNRQISNKHQKTPKNTLQKHKNPRRYRHFKTSTKNENGKPLGNIKQLMKHKNNTSKWSSKDRKLSRLFVKDKCKHKFIETAMNDIDAKKNIHLKDNLNRTDSENIKDIKDFGHIFINAKKDKRHYKDNRKLKNARKPYDRKKVADMKEGRANLKSSRTMDARNTNDMVAVEGGVEKTDPENEQVQYARQYLDINNNNIGREVINEIDKNRVESDEEESDYDIGDSSEQQVSKKEKTAVNDHLNESREHLKPTEAEEPNIGEDFEDQETALDDVDNDIADSKDVDTNSEKDISDYNELDCNKDIEGIEESDRVDSQNDRAVKENDSVDQKNADVFENNDVQTGSSDETALADTESVHTGEKTLTHLNIIHSLAHKIKPYNCDCCKQLTTAACATGTTPCSLKQGTTLCTTTPSYSKCTTPGIKCSHSTAKCNIPYTTKPKTTCITKHTTPCATKQNPFMTKCTTPCEPKSTTTCNPKSPTTCMPKSTTTCKPKSPTTCIPKSTTTCKPKTTTAYKPKYYYTFDICKIKSPTSCTTKCTTKKTPCTTKPSTTSCATKPSTIATSTTTCAINHSRQNSLHCTGTSGSATCTTCNSPTKPTCPPACPTTCKSFELKDPLFYPRSDDAELKDETDRDQEKKENDNRKTGSQEEGHHLGTQHKRDRAYIDVVRSTNEKQLSKLVNNDTHSSRELSIPKVEPQKPALVQETGMWALSREMQGINKKLERIIQIIRGLKKKQKHSDGKKGEISRDTPKEIIMSKNGDEEKLDETEKELNTNADKDIINKDNVDKLQKTNEKRRETIDEHFKISLATKIDNQNLLGHKGGLKHFKKDDRKVDIQHENGEKSVAAVETDTDFDNEVSAASYDENEAVSSNEVEYNQGTEVNLLEKSDTAPGEDAGTADNEDQYEEVDEVNPHSLTQSNTEDETKMNQVNRLSDQKLIKTLKKNTMR